MKKIILAATAAAVVLWGAGCSSKKPAASESGSSSASENNRSTPGKVELKTYSFPEFFGKIKLPDMLSRQIMTSFDPEEHLSVPDQEVFPSYEVTECIDGALYVFQQDKYKGLLNSSGYVVLEADSYTDIRCCGPGMVALSRDKELSSPDDYAYYDGYGNITLAQDYAFDGTRLTVEPVYPNPGLGGDEEEPRLTYDLIVNGVSVCERAGLQSFDKIEQLDMDQVDTTKLFSAYYRADTPSGYCFICVDRFYNFTVFDGAYAFVRLRVGDSYGECYILDGDDYTELLQMIDSFGQSSAAKVPSKDEALDYIQIETGELSGERVTYTVSADGFCFSDQETADGSISNKYFANFDKESFVSLVLWVDQVLSLEYQ